MKEFGFLKDGKKPNKKLRNALSKDYAILIENQEGNSSNSRMIESREVEGSREEPRADANTEEWTSASLIDCYHPGDSTPRRISHLILSDSFLEWKSPSPIGTILIDFTSEVQRKV